jgi:hypothetical protein
VESISVHEGGGEVGKDEKNFKKVFILEAVLLLMFMAACAEIRLNPLHAPPPNAKLRVFI